MVFSLIITIQSSFLGIRRVLGPKSGKNLKILILTLFDPKTAQYRGKIGEICARACIIIWKIQFLS